MRCTAAFRMTTAPTTTLPGASLYAIANRPLRLFEIGIFNTTVTACSLTVCRLTTAGTHSTTVTASAFEPGKTVDGVASQAHTSTPPSLGANIRVVPIGAAIGAGAIFTWDAEGIDIDAGTANGIGIISTTGTAQICDVYFDWDE